MKLLTRLREPAMHQSPPSPAVLTWLDELNKAPSDPYPDSFDNNEHIGVGAAMVQDVAGLEFLDSCRRRIPDIHEEFPPHGLSYDDYASELDY